jgi:electron transfer flavoprotein beta subunit
MDMPETIEVARVKLPCLLSVEKDIHEPRLPSYKKKIATRHRPIRMICLDDFKDKDEKRYGLKGSPTQVEKIFPPSKNADRQMWHGTGEELALKMANKLKELKFY